MEPQRYRPSENEGLTSEQVSARVRDGMHNEYSSNTTKSYGQILKEHFFTFFNILNIVLAALLLAVGAYKDLAFVVIVLANFIIGIVQEFSSKRTLDKLSLIVASRVRVIRNGKTQTIRVGEIVLDDVAELKTGDQIAADAIVLSGYLEVNESLLTGEADVIVKRQGDFLYSGSFVVSGKARAQVEHVGADNYANQISKTAKTHKRRKSELYTTLGRILKIISFIIIPVGVMLFYKQSFILGLIPAEAVVKTVAALIGMIPEGLILMTSIAFVASVIFLAHDETLVQDMYGIETLARVDVICLDKTGTLTQGNLAFEEIIPLSASRAEIRQALGQFCAATQDENATIGALKAAFPPMEDAHVQARIPFSSERKYSSITFVDVGTYILGAADFVTQDSALREQARHLTEGGKRVLLLSHSGNSASDTALPQRLEPLAFIVLSDRVRPDVHDTLAYFQQYDVEIKIISGDHPDTVSYIAQQAGVPHAELCVDASTLHTREQLAEAAARYRVFGRVSPQQKKELVEIMQAHGKKVAMMGDGVNDVLALKEADCSVAVAAGSDAAKNVSDIVLMDSNLRHLLHVVEDGRKIINNIQRVATLFITKTVYAVLLALATLFLFESAYPFTPLHLVIISFVTIGAPSFFLALEPQYDRVKGRFILNVLEKSLPGGLCVFVGILIANILAHNLHYTASELTTMCVFIAFAGGMWVLLKVSRPMTWMRRTIFYGMIGIFAIGVVFFHNFFELSPLTTGEGIATAIICAAMYFLLQLLILLMDQIYARVDLRKTKIAKKLRSLDAE